MKWRRRASERVEPVMDVGDGDRDGLLDFGLKDADRSVPMRRKSKGKGAAARRKSARGGGRFARTRHVIRRAAYWTVVVAVIGAGSLAALVGYYASKLPPPSDWTVPQRPANVRILAANGALISNRADSTGESLTLDEMPPYLPEAVIAIEDRRFYWHFGIDPIGLARAMVTNVRAGRIVEGGSTITQQLAKNLFLTPDRTFERKIQEVILAEWLELRLSKKQILELYLNRVYLGAGAYGVDAAAHRYFGKSARNVTLAEAATLAGLLKAPAHYSPITHPHAAEARTQTVLAAMARRRLHHRAPGEPRHVEPIKPVHDVAGGSGRYVADWVMDMLPRLRRLARPGHRRRHHHRPQPAGGGGEGDRRHARRRGRQVRRRPGRAGRHRPDRRGQGAGRRARLRHQPLQPRGRRAPPAGLGVQAVRLSDGAGGRAACRKRCASTSRCRSRAGSRRTTPRTTAAR